MKTKAGGALFRPASDNGRPRAQHRCTRPRPAQDWAELAGEHAARLTSELRDRLARELSVAPAALDALGLGWDGKRYTWPERDGSGDVVGVATRAPDGTKRAVKGSKRGLAVPAGLAGMEGPVLIVEGPSDVAACFTLGIAAVGRPSNNGGAEHLRRLLVKRDVLVVGERDAKPDGAWPGREGAQHVARALASEWLRAVEWALPPEGPKDVRAWLAARVAGGLDLADEAARQAAGVELLAELDKAADAERPALRVHVRPTAGGSMNATLALGDADAPGPADVLYAGRLRAGERDARARWTDEAIADARSGRAPWVKEDDLRAALEKALREHAAAALAESEEPDGAPNAELLVRLAQERYRLGVSTEGEPFAVELKGPNVALPLRGSNDALRARLARELRREHGRTPSGSALADALNVLAGEAQDAKPEPVYLRVAREADIAGRIRCVVIDNVGDSAERAIVVEPGGWRVVERSPVLFRRTALTGAMTEPALGGDVGRLWEHVAFEPRDRDLVLAWLLHAFIEGEPHPVLLLGGEQGTGKTTTAERLVDLIDPSPALTRGEPRDQRQYAGTISASRVVAYDNISHVQSWLSDSLCRAVTGDALLDRRLYTDFDVAVVRIQRVFVLTSIDPGALRGDLGERMLLAELECIPEELRRTRSELDAAWAADRPAILGALLDLLAKVLRALPNVRPERSPRMADFGRMLAALDGLRGTDSLAAYAAQGRRVAEDVVAGDPVAAAVVKAVEREGELSGTPGELLDRLTPDAPPKGWPANARAMSGKLKRVAPALRKLGVEVIAPAPKDRPRVWRLGSVQKAYPTDGTDGPTEIGPEGPERADSAPSVGPSDRRETDGLPTELVAGPTVVPSVRRSALPTDGAKTSPGGPAKADFRRSVGSVGRSPLLDGREEEREGAEEECDAEREAIQDCEREEEAATTCGEAVLIGDVIPHCLREAGIDP